MGSYTTFLCVLLMILASAHSSDSQTPIRTNAAGPSLFVSVADGNDNNPGTLAQPFKTIGRAQTAVRALKSKQTVTVFFRGGLYTLDQTWNLSPEDSGVSEDAFVLWTSYQGEPVSISGGIHLPKWEKVSGPTNMFKAQIIPKPKVAPNQLFINGARRGRARTPNYGNYLYYDHVLSAPNDPRFGFTYAGSDLNGYNSEKDKLNVVVYHSWTTSRHYVANIFESNRTIFFTNPANSPIGTYGIQAGKRYYIEGARKCLDVGGEWYYDEEEGAVLYMAYDSEDPNTGDSFVSSSSIQELVLLQGTPTSPVQHIRFEGLNFEISEWYISPTEVADFQAASFLTTALIHTQYAVNIEFLGCTIRHSGTYGVWFDRGSQHCTLDGSEVLDTGAGGVRIGEGAPPTGSVHQTGFNAVDGNSITNGGAVFRSGVGVLIQRASNNNVTANLVAHFAYTGISIGWSWGYQIPSGATDNYIALNYIHDIGQKQLCDMGGIYTLGVSNGTRIYNNVIHDVHSYAIYDWGIYLDEGSSGIVISNNIVHHTGSAGFFQHYGENNVATNNVFASAGGGDADVAVSLPEDHMSYTFANNIVLHDSNNPSSYLFKMFQPNVSVAFNNNIYWVSKPTADPSTGLQFGDAGETWVHWRASGQDSASVLVDPQFTSPDYCMYYLQATSPALKRGFKQVEYLRTPTGCEPN